MFLPVRFARPRRIVERPTKIRYGFGDVLARDVVYSRVLCSYGASDQMWTKLVRAALRNPGWKLPVMAGTAIMLGYAAYLGYRLYQAHEISQAEYNRSAAEIKAGFEDGSIHLIAHERYSMWCIINDPLAIPYVKWCARRKAISDLLPQYAGNPVIAWTELMPLGVTLWTVPMRQFSVSFSAPFVIDRDLQWLIPLCAESRCPTVVLDLSNQKSVTDAGIKYLLNLHRIRRLDLRGTSVTAEGVQLLQDHFRECKILWQPPSQPASLPLDSAAQ
jgi:hypothetical protein